MRQRSALTATAGADEAMTQKVDLDNLDSQRHLLDPLDQGLSAGELRAKALDAIGYCLDHHPGDLEACARSLEDIILVNGEVERTLGSHDSIEGIYIQSIGLSEQLVSTWSFSLLAVALALRMIYELTQLARGGINFASLGLDVIFYSLLTGGYVLAVKLLVGFYIDISAYFSSEALLDKLRSYVGALRTKVEEDADSMSSVVDVLGFNLVDSALALFTSFFAFFVSIFQYFVLLAHGILFTIVVVAGTVVVPLSLAGYFNVFSGWIKLCSTVVLFPLVQAVMFWALLLYLDNAGFLSLDGSSATIQSFELHFVENLANLSVIVIFLIAPFITNVIVTGSGNLASVLTPMYLAGALIARQASSSLAKAASGDSVKGSGGGLDAEGGKPSSDGKDEGGREEGETLANDGFGDYAAEQTPLSAGRDSNESAALPDAPSGEGSSPDAELASSGTPVDPPNANSDGEGGSGQESGYSQEAGAQADGSGQNPFTLASLTDAFVDDGGHDTAVPDAQPGGPSSPDAAPEPVGQGAEPSLAPSNGESGGSQETVQELGAQASESAAALQPFASTQAIGEGPDSQGSASDPVLVDSLADEVFDEWDTKPPGAEPKGKASEEPPSTQLVSRAGDPGSSIPFIGVGGKAAADEISTGPKTQSPRPDAAKSTPRRPKPGAKPSP